MGTEKNPRRVADNEAMAVLRMLRTSPQKLNLVAASIRGMPVQKALNELEFSRKRIAGDVRKTSTKAATAFSRPSTGAFDGNRNASRITRATRSSAICLARASSGSRSPGGTRSRTSVETFRP